MMEWYESDVQSLEAARAKRSLIPQATVFYGSSTLRLWSTLAADLQNPKAVNCAFGGSTLQACAYFFERIVVPERPASFILYAGDNDLGDGQDPFAVCGSFRSLAKKLNAALGPIPFGFISIKPSPARFSIVDRIRLANSLIHEQVDQLPNAYYIDLFDAMLNPDKTPRPELFESDGLHMNPSGYQLWIRLLAPFRNQMFTPQSYALKAGAVSLTKE